MSALSRILKGDHRVGAALGGLSAQEQVLTTRGRPPQIKSLNRTLPLHPAAYLQREQATRRPMEILSPAMELPPEESPKGVPLFRSPAQAGGRPVPREKGIFRVCGSFFGKSLGTPYAKPEKYVKMNLL